MDVEKLLEENQTLKVVSQQRETLWINPQKREYNSYEKSLPALPITDEEIREAEERLERFAPFIREVFPETEKSKGIIESPLVEIFGMQRELEERYRVTISGKLLLKMDSHLPISGSIKARGGVYEVLKRAEELAIEAGILSVKDDYSIISQQRFRTLFSGYKIQVGSTGNLGLSIGIISAALGFEVIVHMSCEAKQWKKDLLRSKGVTVVEYEDDYGKAVAEGRRSSQSDPKSYFIDDENSRDLFLGYAVAGSRLKKQLEEKKIVVDREHPLIVYLPCGVGGAPGGVAYGIKRIFKENAHCFFVEPTLSPCLLVGMATQLHDKISVHDIGITGVTHADGLAVARPSGFIGKVMEPVLSGVFTVDDANLYNYLRDLKRSEGRVIEPSACAAFQGPITLLEYEQGREYVEENLKGSIENACQIAWATGGEMVPEEEMNHFLETYLSHL